MVFKLEDLVFSLKSFDNNVILFFQLIFLLLDLFKFLVLFVLVPDLCLQLSDLFCPFDYFVIVFLISHIDNF